MNLILEGLSFCNPFLKKKQDENLQTKKTQGTVECTRKKSSMKTRPNHPVETDSDSSVEPKPKIYFKDDNFLILHPDFVTYSREDDESSVHSNMKTYPFSVHEKSNVCNILDNEKDFDEIMARICKKRLMSGEECECSRCRTLHVIKESLKHPGTFSWGNKYPDDINNRSDLQSAKKSIKHDAALLRIEIALHNLMEKLSKLEKMAEGTSETKCQLNEADFCNTHTQYSSQNLGEAQRPATKIPNLKYKKHVALSDCCHKTWSCKQNTVVKQKIKFAPTIKDLDSNCTNLKLPCASNRIRKAIIQE